MTKLCITFYEISIYVYRSSIPKKNPQKLKFKKNKILLVTPYLHKIFTISPAFFSLLSRVKSGIPSLWDAAINNESYTVIL